MGKRKFYIYQEDLIQYKIVNTHINISKMVNNLNLQFREENMKALRSEEITTYLERKGFLFLDDNRKKPTKKGKLLGIKVEKYYDLKGNEYEMNIYNECAQKYILDNLYDIIF